MGEWTVGDPPRTYYAFYLEAVPNGRLHRNVNTTGDIPERAACGFRPRHGWLVAQTRPIWGRPCLRCVAVVRE